MPIPEDCQPVPEILQKAAHLFYWKGTNERKRGVKFCNQKMVSVKPGRYSGGTDIHVILEKSPEKTKDIETI